jgi:hypothetical protein
MQQDEHWKYEHMSGILHVCNSFKYMHCSMYLLQNGQAQQATLSWCEFEKEKKKFNFFVCK